MRRKADINKAILLVRTTTTVNMQRLRKVNSVSFDQLVDSKRSSRDAKHGKKPPDFLNVFFAVTVQDTLVYFIEIRGQCA